MTIPDPPDYPLMKEGSESYLQLSRSKLGKELYGSNVSYSIAEHPTAFRYLIGTILTIVILICAILNHSEVLVCSILLFLSIVAMCLILIYMAYWSKCELLKNPDDLLFFLKLVAAGHSWEDIGRIMNSYLFQKGLWWTNCYFYDSKECYSFFVSYSKECTDPVIQIFIERTKRKLSERMAQRWEGIQLPDVN
ncbi:protein PRM8 [Kluyveromyces marxianus]|uniref:Protein PRM8 n=1 Tax=Kluyveromyces marxianus TaxID=4911 RepID=A0ABX6F514_KLUMA|nr:protein PRM8 [Kluyveromyces marxianus]